MRHNQDPRSPPSVLSFISLSPFSHSHPQSSAPSHTLPSNNPRGECVLRMWDDEANVLLAANYINALPSLNCLSLPAQPFPNTGALSCLSRGWLLRAQAGPEVWEGGDTRDGRGHADVHTEQRLQPACTWTYSKRPSGNVLSQRQEGPCKWKRICIINLILNGGLFVI